MIKRVFTSVFILLITLALALAAVAATNLEVISAYLNHTVSIEYEGSELEMYDVLGNEVYPITYDGTTYLPLRALADLFDVSVDYDDETKTVTLGADELASDFIDDLTPYAGNYSLLDGIILSVDDKTKSIAGETYDHWIYLDSTQYLYYNLDGNYTDLDFFAYCPSSSRNDRYDLCFYGDGELIETFKVHEHSLPSECSVDLTGVKELRICSETPDGKSSTGEIYLFSMTIN